MSTANLPKPPGGKLVCPRGFTPISKRSKFTGEIQAECRSRQNASTPRELGNLILNEIFGGFRMLGAPILPREAQILQKGYYEDKDFEYGFEIVDIQADPSPMADY